MNKLLVHLHLFYQDQLDYMIKKLSNIEGCDWDLYVTVCEENSLSEEKILKFKPDAKIIKVENRGYDIWPFIQVLRMVNLDDYDYVLKIHTKAYREKRCYINNFEFNIPKFYHYYWRNKLIRPLIGSNQKFKKNLKILAHKKKIGMIVDKSFFIKLDKNNTTDTLLLKNIKERLNIKSDYNLFIAGTMFLIRACILKRIVASDINQNDFDNNAKTGTDGKTVHAIERVFSILAIDEGYKILPIKNHAQYFKKDIKEIFSVRNSNDKRHKIITILGIKIKLKRK